MLVICVLARLTFRFVFHVNAPAPCQNRLTQTDKEDASFFFFFTYVGCGAYFPVSAFFMYCVCFNTAFSFLRIDSVSIWSGLWSSSFVKTCFMLSSASASLVVFIRQRLLARRSQALGFVKIHCNHNHNPSCGMKSAATYHAIMVSTTGCVYVEFS